MNCIRRFGVGISAATLLLPQLGSAESLNNTQVATRRSLIVTELSILMEFSLKCTMDQLAAQAAVAGITGEKLSANGSIS